MAKIIQIKTKGRCLIDHELIDVPVTSLKWFGNDNFTINLNHKFHFVLTEDDVEWLLSRMKPRNLISRKISRR